LDVLVPVMHRQLSLQVEIPAFGLLGAFAALGGRSIFLLRFLVL
jgi:hypothetical protein